MVYYYSFCQNQNALLVRIKSNVVHWVGHGRLSNAKHESTTISNNIIIISARAVKLLPSSIDRRQVAPPRDCVMNNIWIRFIYYFYGSYIFCITFLDIVVVAVVYIEIIKLLLLLWFGIQTLDTVLRIAYRINWLILK
jgi:hypothetical protein